MRLLYARFRGLIGVYRASNLKEIFIDFRKCIHPITLITGPNGSGKSTIMDQLHPLPDSQSVYLPKEPAFKELEYLMDDGTVYRLRIDYPINKYGERTTTKAFIYKIVDGMVIDLNPNGNVSSYRDTLVSNFRLDPNFIQLSYLSVENRGLVDLTPAERKKFVGSIIAKVEVYNNMLKTLNKRYTQFKSLLNSIVAKIDSIGDEETLNLNLKSIETRINKLTLDRDNLLKMSAKCESTIQLLDPNNEIQDNYKTLSDQRASIQEQLRLGRIVLAKYSKEPYSSYLGSLEICLENEKAFQSLSNDLSKSLLEVELTISSLIRQREDEAEAIAKKQTKLASMRVDIDIDALKRDISLYENQLKEYETFLNRMGLTIDTALTKDEFISGLNTLLQIKEHIDTVRSYNYLSNMDDALSAIENNISIADMIYILQTDISCIEEKISKITGDIEYYNRLLERMSILNIRPTECSVDSCIFIKEGIAAKAENPQENLDRLSIELAELNDSLSVKKEALNNYIDINGIINNMRIVFRFIDNNASILNKLPNGSMFTNKPILISAIKKGSTFSEVYDLYQYIDQANILEEYKLIKSGLESMYTNLEIYNNRNSILEELMSDIAELNTKLNSLTEQISQSQIKRDSITVEKAEVDSKLVDIEKAKLYYIRDNDMCAELAKVESGLSSISANMQNIASNIENINRCNSSIANIDGELTPLNREREQTRFSLSKLDEYRADYELYQRKCSLTETLIKYSSPTKDGIQLLFMQVYMGQVMSNANKLLKMLFKGELELGAFIINEKEFKIPCKSMESPIVNDDISSCSTAQRCMISMILSFALLMQSSTEYNIIRLDEIDGGLDSDNRTQFINVLLEIMELLQVSNCIMISHNTEIPISNCNVIDLYGDTRCGNIIFRYTDPENKTA